MCVCIYALGGCQRKVENRHRLRACLNDYTATAPLIMCISLEAVGVTRGGALDSRA